LYVLAFRLEFVLTTLTVVALLAVVGADYMKASGISISINLQASDYLSITTFQVVVAGPDNKFVVCLAKVEGKIVVRSQLVVAACAVSHPCPIS
jgi:hypothetical protein